MRTIHCPETTLNNGIKMPQVGFGLAMQEAGQMQTIIDAAIQTGYRMFDTSPLYGNECEFGQAIKNNGIPREELFICSKLRNSKQQYDDALAAFEDTRKALGVEYLDLYMVYWPCPAYDRYCEAWKALEHLYRTGAVRAIGVSNFLPEHLERLSQESDIVPVVNELECNPYLSIMPLRKYCQTRNIQVEAWFPLGGPTIKLGGEPAPGPRPMEDPIICSIAEKYGRSAAQVILRWELQSGIVPLPKSSRPERMQENLDIFDFTLTEQEIYDIDMLDRGLRKGHDPATTNDQF